MTDPVRLLPKPAPSYSEWRAQNVAALWNAFVPLGHPVRYHGNPTDRAGFATHTRGPAYVRMLGHVAFAVVEIDGIGNPVPIDHLAIETPP